MGIDTLLVLVLGLGLGLGLGFSYVQMGDICTYPPLFPGCEQPATNHVLDG